MWLDENKSTFELMAQSPHMWLASAQQLKRAADLVASEFQKIVALYPDGRAPYHDLALFNPYMLMSGLALESLIKGILIVRNPQSVTPDRFNRKDIVKGQGGHDLIELAQQVNISYSATELDLLSRLSKFVVWAGNYPIHLRASETNAPSFHFADIGHINGLYDRYVKVLETENPEPTVQFV